MKKIEVKDKVIEIVLITISLFYIFRNFLEILSIKFWRHDSLLYYNDYTGRLKSEGRWINYYLFDVIREIPPILSIVIHILCISYFVYYISVNITKNKTLSLIFVLTIVSIPGLYSQLLWPLTSLPAFIFLGVLPYLSLKLSKNKIFFLSGVVFFGTFSNYYFLVPLLYLSEYTNKEFTFKNCIYFIKKILIPWIICFLIGYICANLITYILSDQFIILAKWRNPKPINSINQLISNYKQISVYFFRDIKQIYNSLGSIIVSILVIYNVIVFKKENFLYIINCILVMLGLYVTTLYHGIYIAERTSIILWIGMLFMLLLNKYKRDKKNLCNILLCFVVGIALSRSTYRNLNWYSTLSSIYNKELQKGNIDLNPYKYNKVIILIEDKEILKLNQIFSERENLKPFGGLEGLSQVGRTIIPLLKSHGFTRIGVGPKIIIEKDSKGIFIKSIDNQSNLIIELNKDFIK